MRAQMFAKHKWGLPCCSAVQEHHLKALHVKWSLVLHPCRLRCMMLATLQVCRHMSCDLACNWQGHSVNVSSR